MYHISTFLAHTKYNFVHTYLYVLYLQSCNFPFWTRGWVNCSWKAEIVEIPKKRKKTPIRFRSLLIPQSPFDNRKLNVKDSEMEEQFISSELLDVGEGEEEEEGAATEEVEIPEDSELEKEEKKVAIKEKTGKGGKKEVTKGKRKETKVNTEELEETSLQSPGKESGREDELKVEMEDKEQSLDEKKEQIKMMIEKTKTEVEYFRDFYLHYKEDVFVPEQAAALEIYFEPEEQVRVNIILCCKNIV